MSTNVQSQKAAVEKDLVRAWQMAKDLLDERVEVNTESEQKMENLNVSIIGARSGSPHTYEKHGDLSIYKQCKLYIFTQLCVGTPFDVVVLMNVLSTWPQVD